MVKLISLFVFCLLPAAALAADGVTALDQLQTAAGPGAGQEVQEPLRGGGGGCTGVCVPGSFAVQAARAYRYLPNHITLHNVPPPYPIDWQTLGGLAASTAKSAAAVGVLGQNHSIGHVTFDIGCTLPDGSRTLVVSGQSVRNMGGFVSQIIAGDGYATFFGYVDGFMQSREQVEQDYDKLSNQAGEMSLMTFMVSPESCLAAQRYVRDYNAEGVYARYGLGVRPLYKEGGGCANVGASVLQVAGPAAFGALAAPWSRTLYLPTDMFGTAEHPIGLWDTVKQRNYRWMEKTDVPHKVLFFYDPEPMHYWVQDAYKAGYAASAGKPVRRYTVNKAPGVILDYTAESAATSWWLHD